MLVNSANRINFIGLLSQFVEFHWIREEDVRR
jgi:hypothetical protein